MPWWLIEDDGVDAAAGLAADELLAQRLGAGTSPPTLRLYTYRPHSALAGRFQNVDNEINVAQCDAHGIEVNRRPTGGGAILMGPDQLGIALTMRGRGDGQLAKPRTLMQRFSAGIVQGLGMLGITASFRGKNDVEVDGRKIAGLGVYRDPSGGLLYHASLLVDLDVALMAQVLRMPFVDLDDRELAMLATRTTSVRAGLHRAVSVAEVRARMAAGFKSAFAVQLEGGELYSDEKAGVAALVDTKYGTRAWVHQDTTVEDTTGGARTRTASGAIELRVAMAGPTLKAVHVRGDFFAADAAIIDLEARLRWHPGARDKITATITEWAQAHPAESVATDALIDTIEKAVRQASGEPYGCFVTPEQSHA